MRFLGKALKILFVTAGLLSVLVIGFLLSVLKWPQWVMNPSTFRMLANFSSRFGTVITWEGAQIQPISFSLFHKRFDFTFDHFCFTREQNFQQGCFEKLQFSFEMAWENHRLRIIELGPVVMEGGNVSLHFALPENPKPVQLELSLPDLVLPPWLRETVFRKVSMEFKQLGVQIGEELLFGSLQMTMEPTPEGRVGEVFLKVSIEEGLKTQSADLEGRLTSESYFLKNDWVLQGGADLQLKSKETLHADLKIFQVRPKFFSYEMTATGSSGKKKAQFKILGNLGEKELKGRAEGEVSGVSKRIHRLSFQNCSFDLKQKKERAALSIDCPVRVGVTPVKLPSATYTQQITLPQNLDFVAKMDLDSALSFSLQNPVSGTLNVQLTPLSQAYYRANGTAKTRFSGIPARYPQGWAIVTDLDFNATLIQIQKWVKSLDRTAYAVPAPLHALDGTVSVGVKGRADVARNKGELPITFNTQLQSKDQRFNSEGKGSLKYQYSKSGSNSDTTMELQLTDLTLALPRFGYSSLPSLFPDPRFKNPNAKITAPRWKNQVAYHFKIRTAPDHPARLISNLARENIPLTLDLNLENGKVGGTIEVGRTPIHFFRRDAFIEDFKIALADPQDASEINGRFRVDYADYQIGIFLLGTAGRPTVLFQSDPPLSEDQVLSVLIYGRTFDSLDENKANTISSTSAAFADKAVTLGSLFLFASTPIQSVSYNPATGVFAAKIRLAEGTALNLTTTDTKTQQAGIRKNLGGNWLINTYIENDSETSKQSAGATLEWNKRY